MSQYILKPYWWSQVIELFPLSMAPNMITLTGFFFVNQHSTPYFQKCC